MPKYGSDKSASPALRPPLYLWAMLLAGGFWLLESVLHWQFFTADSALSDHLVPADANELWMRVLIAALLIAGGAYAEYTITRARRAEALLREILDATNEAYIDLARDWRVRYFNPRAEALFETALDEAADHNFWDLFPEAASSFYKPAREALTDGQERTVDGYYSAAGRWIEAYLRPADDGLALYLRDITRQREREAHLQHSHKHLQTILDNAGDGIITIDGHGRIETFNRAAEAMFGYRAESVIGSNVKTLMPATEATHHDGYLSAYMRTSVGGLIEQGPREVTALRADGTTFPMELGVSEMRFHGERKFIGVVRDITERKEVEDKLQFMSNYDPLTGLPNRSLLHDRLQHALFQADRKEQLVAVMFLDLDQFKNINDTLGHARGDELLQRAAKRLEGCVRESDTVARLGGDEFVILLEGLSHVDDAALVAQDVLDAFVTPMRVADHEVLIGVSIGITIYPFDDDNIDDLLKDADTAMYRAKEMGRNNYQYFTADMTRHALAHMRMDQDLRRALERKEFELFYQPQIDVASGAVVGLEALLRWRHPEQGLVSPGEFIPVLEETGLILPVGEWVLRSACEQAYRWSQQGFPAVRMAVNLSALQFNDRGLAEKVGGVLARTGLPAHRLELEITEGLLVENVERNVETLAELHRMGVQLSVDDFGTGYSSLAYLKRFPLHTLKIDKSFVGDVTEDADSAAIARAIIALAENLRLKVIAEGVETPSQLAFLQSEGCGEVQGFLFCRPLPAKKLEAWLRQYHPTRLN